MVHPFKGHGYKRFVERKDPFYTHFVGYLGNVDPRVIFEEKIRKVTEHTTLRGSREIFSRSQISRTSKKGHRRRASQVT